MIEWTFKMAIGILIALIGWFLRKLDKKLGDLSKEVHLLEISQKDFVSRRELSRMLKPLGDKIDKISGDMSFIKGKLSRTSEMDDK